MVLFISTHDVNNVGRLFAEALMRVDVPARSVVQHKNLYAVRGYREKSNFWKTVAQLQLFVNEAEIVVFMHSAHIRGLNLSGKRVAVFAGGSRYRQKAEQLNQNVFNELVDFHLIQTADLLGRGAKREFWIFPPIDTDFIQPHYRNNSGPLVFGHFPRRPKSKGTAKILPILKSFKCAETLYGDAIVPWEASIRRMSGCDVYVERMNLWQVKKKSGVWGMAAMEAAALGKIVISNDLHREKYEKEFGPCPILVANTPSKLQSYCQMILEWNLEEIVSLQTKTREWVTQVHGFVPTGKRLKSILLG